MATKKQTKKQVFILSDVPLSEIPHGATDGIDNLLFINGSQKCCEEEFKKTLEGDQSRYSYDASTFEASTGSGYEGFIYELVPVAKLESNQNVKVTSLKK